MPEFKDLPEMIKKAWYQSAAHCFKVGYSSAIDNMENSIKDKDWRKH